MKLLRNVIVFIIIFFVLTITAHQSYAGWTDLNAAAGAGTTILRADGVGPSGQYIIVGDSGFIKTSTDGGTTWTDRNAAAGAGATILRGAAIGPSGQMLVVGDSFVKTSTDGGASWTDRSAAAGTGATQVMGAAIGPSGQMFIVGLSGYSRVSTDGGASWSNPNFTTFHLLNCAIGPSGQMLAAATDQIWTSTDGVSWTNRTAAASVNASDIYGAAFGPSGQMLAGGLGNGFLKTSTDGGASWTDRVSAAGVLTTDTIRATAISSTGQMAAMGANGFFKTSTDGGASWTDQNAAAGAGTIQLRDVEYGASDSMLVVGESGFVKKYTANTSPTITAGPSASYQGGNTRVGAAYVTWNLSFTATDSEQTGANALTYYVHTGANRTGTQVATGTFTSGNGNNISIAYNASGMVEGTNTLYLSVYDGTNYSATNPSFTVLRDTVAPTSATGISTNQNPVTSTTYNVTFTQTDDKSINANEIAYNIRTASGGGGSLLTSGNLTSGVQKTTSNFTDSTLTQGANTRYIRVCDGANNCIDTSFTVTFDARPTVTTSAAGSVTNNSAILNSTVNPNGASTSVNYLWGTSTTGTTSSDCALLPNTLSGPIGLTGTANLSGATTQATLPSLSPNQTYYFCVMATNTYGTTYGNVLNFTTSPTPGAYQLMNAGSALGGGATDCNDASAAPCAPTPGAVSAASQTSVTVSWSASTGPTPTSYTVVCVSGGACNNTSRGTQASGFTDSGLTCGTTYTYTVTAINADGSSPASSTFSGATSSCASAPTVATNAVTNITATGAQFNGTFSTNNGTGNVYWFRYGTTNTGNCSTLASATGTSSFSGTNTAANTVISGLTPNTTYYVCAAASNNVGTTYGSITSFTTLVAWNLVDSTYQLYSLNEIAMPADNIPVMAFQTGGGGVKVAKCTTTACTAFTVTTLAAGGNTGTGTRVGIAISGDGLPIVAYETGGSLMAYKCTVANCSSGTSTNLGAFAGNINPSVAVGSDGLPLISHNAAGQFRVFKCNTNACTGGTDYTLYSATVSGAYSKIAIVGGYPVMFFEDDANFGMRYLRCTSLTCNAAASTTLLATWGASVPVPSGSIRAASDGLPIMIFSAMNSSATATGGYSAQTSYIFKCTNIDCTAKNAYGGWASSQGPYLDVPADGNPVAAIPTSSGGNKLMFIKCTTSTCSSYNTYNAVTGLMNWPQGAAVETDSSNIPFLLYPHTASGTNGTMMIKCSSSSSCP